MNRKMITDILKKKHKDFVESITNAKVRDLVQHNSIITGGCIASMLVREPVNDFDYYFTNIETVVAVAEYYVKKFMEMHPETKIPPQVVRSESGQLNPEGSRVQIRVQSAGVISESGDKGYEYFEQFPDEKAMEYVESMVTKADEVDSAHMEEIDKEKGKYRPIFMTQNAITLSDKVQLIIRFHGTPQQIHDNYDFVHCCNYWLSDNETLYLSQNALESLLARHLQYHGSLYPICSVIRTRKFIKKGWHINAGQYLKMCFQISELDLSNMTVLEDQLTGVDSAYFAQVVEYCKQRMEKDTSFKVTAPYLISIIDKIFG